jgi:hypothetical protein
LRDLELPALREVGTSAVESLVELSLDSGELRRLSFPRLGAVHGTVAVFGLSGLETLEIPKLVAVDRSFSLMNLPRLSALEMSSNLRASETPDFEYLCKLPATSVPLPADVGAFKAVGCCTESALACETQPCNCDLDTQ